MAERVKLGFGVLEQHQIYLKMLHDAKLSEEQTLLGYFRHLEEQIANVVKARIDMMPMISQKLLDENNLMIQEFQRNIKKDHGRHRRARRIFWVRRGRRTLRTRWRL